MTRTLSTDAVAAPRRLAFWTDLVCGTYVHLECDPPEGRDRIEGEIVTNEVATLKLTRVTATAQFIKRTSALIARGNEDNFLVNIQTAGRCVISQDGRHAVLGPGDFALHDSTRPYELTFDDAFKQFVLKLPGPTLRSALRETEKLTATKVRGDYGAGRLLIGMIRTLAADIDALAPESAAAVAESVTQILIAGLATLPAARRAPVSQLTAYYREQIKALVRSRLADAELSVAQIAQALHLSPSTLHRAWAGEPCSLSDWIWSQRLDATRHALCNPACAGRTVSEIAFSWGFNDASHFSRAFRARFGCSPRDMRPGAVCRM